jgi:hypothetical protein
LQIASTRQRKKIYFRRHELRKLGVKEHNGNVCKREIKERESGRKDGM